MKQLLRNGMAVSHSRVLLLRQTGRTKPQTQVRTPVWVSGQLRGAGTGQQTLRQRHLRARARERWRRTQKQWQLRAQVGHLRAAAQRGHRCRHAH